MLASQWRHCQCDAQRRIHRSYASYASELSILTTCQPCGRSLTFSAVLARFFRSENHYTVHAIVYAEYPSVKGPWGRKIWKTHRCVRPARSAQRYADTPLFSFFGLPSREGSHGHVPARHAIVAVHHHAKAHGGHLKKWPAVVLIKHHND